MAGILYDPNETLAPPSAKQTSEQTSADDNNIKLLESVSYEGSVDGRSLSRGSQGGSQGGSNQPPKSWEGSKVGSQAGSYQFTPRSINDHPILGNTPDSARSRGQKHLFQSMLSDRAESRGGKDIFESSSSLSLPPNSSRGSNSDDLPVPKLPTMITEPRQNGAPKLGSLPGPLYPLGETEVQSTDIGVDISKPDADSAPTWKPFDKGKKRNLKGQNCALHIAMERAGGDPKARAAQAAEMGRMFAKQASKMDLDTGPVDKKGSSLQEVKQSFHYKMLKAADSRALTIVVFSCVFLNGIQMGFQTDHQGGVLEIVYNVLDNIFTVVFTVEMVIKLSAYRAKYFCDKWNVFDFFITSISIIDLWILSAMGGGPGMKVLAVFRIFRVFRAVRLLRMLKSLRELALIVEGLMHSLGTTIWVSLLLLMLLYIFSILCVRIIGRPGTYAAWSEDQEDFPEAVEFNSYQFFGTVPRAMFTLLNLAMLTDDWYVVSRALLEVQPGVLAIFLIFVLFCNFGLLNVIVGITVESVMKSGKELEDRDDDERKKAMLIRLETLYEFVFTLDTNKDETIDASELVSAWDRPELQELLSIVNLPVGAEADELVDLIDSNGDGKLEMEEFVRSLVRLLTSDQFQQILEIKGQQNRVSRNIKLLRQDLEPVIARGRHELATKKEVDGLRSEVREVKSMLRTIHNELIQIRQGSTKS